MKSANLRHHVLIGFGLMLGLPLAQAATPAMGTLSPTQPTLEFSSGPNAVSNAAGDCSVLPCDTYDITLDIPAGFTATHPDAKIKVELTWDVDPDYDLQAEENGSQIATAGATGSPEIMEISSTKDGIRNITVNIVPFAVSGGTATGVITFIAGAERAAPPPGAGGGGGGAVSPTVPNPIGPGVPRYQVYAPPESLSGDTGEPSVGYNPETKQAFVLSGLRTLWATFPSERTPALPLACDADWEERTFAGNSLNTLDPIGLTDSLVRGHETGRTWIDHLQGKAHITAYTDNDGATWTPTEGNAPVVTGFDHQGIGVGPYPKTGIGASIPHPAYPNAFYYCGQDIAYANCTRSDDGGITFQPPQQMYQLTTCGGLHGHPRVSVDGTVYVPNPGCGGKTAVAVSEDAGTTWTVRPVEGSTASGWDPQVALGTDGTAFLCYADGLNASYGTFSSDKGKTWSTPVRLGAVEGIEHSAFPQAVAGTPGRASCGYLGTRTKGNPNAADFGGVWHLYFSTTYDGGNTWVTVNATPDDPVQGAGGIWDGGGGNFNRNLLDFNEMTIDENGYPIYGYTDGCIGSCNKDPTANTFTASPRIARQIAGKSLYDDVQMAVEPRVAAQACLAGVRTAQDATLTWRVPENGGAAISGYKVFRGTTTGALTQVGETGPKPFYRDLAVDPNVADYFYTVKAVNAQGESLFSNEVQLPLPQTPVVAENVCTVPGISIATDGAGDGKAANTDILALNVAEPQADDGKLRLTMKVASLNPVAPGVLYTVRFHLPTQPIGEASDTFIGMVQDGPAPKFVYGSVDIMVVSLTAVTVYTVQGELPGSSFSPDGTINFIVPRETFELKAGDQLANFIVNVHSGAASSGSHTQRSQTVLDEIAGTINYRLRDDKLCLPNTAPKAVLALSATQVAPGTKVLLDGRGSSDAEEGIKEYYFDFGDGSPALTTTQPTAEYTYTKEGFYRARLLVKDDRDLENENVAQQTIEVGSKASGPGAPGVPGVGPAPGPGSAVTAQNAGEGRFGGSFGVALLPLALFGLRRRRH